jgi:hypothetical protein
VKSKCCAAFENGLDVTGEINGEVAPEKRQKFTGKESNLI